jgi:hypothetical protein
MRNCKNCNEELEDNFEICWKCGSENELINNEGNKVDFEIPNVNTQDSLSFAFSPREYDNSTSKENFSAINSQNTNKKKNKIFIITIIVIVFVSYMSSLDKNSSNSNSTSSTYGANKNINKGDHIAYVKNNFQSSGKDVYQISIIGNNGENGYIIYVSGYDRQRGFSFDCNVKTDGTNGIIITDTGLDVRTQY